MAARRFAGWWIALFGMWLLLAGEGTRLSAIWGAAAALVAAVAATVVAGRAGAAGHVRLRWLAELPRAAVAVVVDLAVVTAALAGSMACGQRERGVFVRDRSRAGGDREAAGRRAWVELVATWSANSYVIDVSPATGRRLLHDLVPRRSSESPS